MWAEQWTLRWAEHPGPHVTALEEYFIPKYEEETGVKVIMEVMPPDLMREKMMLEAQARTYYYDMGYHSPGWFGYYYRHVKGLDEFIEKYNFDLDQYPPSLFESHMTSQIMRPGEVIAIARNPQTPFYVYRKDWFAHPDERTAFKEQFGRELEPPETWEELYDIAVFFTRDAGEKVAGKVLEMPLYGYSASIKPPGGMARAFLAIVYSLGLKGWDENFEPDIDHPILLKGVEYLSRLIRHTFPPAAETWDFLEHLWYFREGRLATAELWAEGVMTVEDPTGKSVGKVGYATFPKWPGNLLNLPIGRSFLGGGGTLIFDTPKAEEAFKFLQWLYEKNEVEFNLRTATFSRTRHFTDPGILAVHPFYPDFLPVFQAQMEYGFPRQPIPEWGDVMYRAAGEFASDVLHGIMTPQEAQKRWVDYMRREFEAAGYYD
ncbi:extracellular solute-binding protein [Candidatus Aerophobetes bacterium]|nr:extracellular solute-binding protein [Candidatus Aerophobetes bacterium]